MLEGDDEEGWFLCHGTWEDLPFFARGRRPSNLPVGDDRYPQQLRVTWKYTCHDESQLPTRIALQEMNDFEDLLIETLEKAGAIFTATVTCEGMREWLFYCSSIQDSAKAFNEVFAYLPRKPIEITGGDDRSWDSYRGILAEFTDMP